MIAMEKVAAVYEEAHRLNGIEKVAASYEVEHLPEHYKEALYKEAILPQIGGAIARGAGAAAKKVLPKAGTLATAMPNARSNAAKGVNWMRNNKKLVGGAAVGAAGLGTAAVGRKVLGGSSSNNSAAAASLA